MDFELNKVYCMDALAGLKKLPDETIDMCVTSPPYWGLRDYGVKDQIGMESPPSKYVDKLSEIFLEVNRVLKSTGTLWVNLGDTYFGSWGGYTRKDDRTRVNPDVRPPNSILAPELKSKDLVGIPWLVAFRLRSDGWYLRSDIIWSKSNPMPESVTDRCSKSHEYIFMLSKSKKYYFDGAAIKEPIAESTKKRLNQNIYAQNGSSRVQGKGNGPMKAVGSLEGRNKRTVWEVSTSRFKGAHFATFPINLIEPCILAGCPRGGVVLDPFMGSGTTAYVARYSGRSFIGFEINPEYVELSNIRLSQQVLSNDVKPKKRHSFSIKW